MHISTNLLFEIDAAIFYFTNHQACNSLESNYTTKIRFILRNPKTVSPISKS